METIIAGIKVKILVPIIVGLSGILGTAIPVPPPPKVKVETPRIVVEEKKSTTTPKISDKKATTTVSTKKTATKKSTIATTTTQKTETNPVTLAKTEILSKITRGEVLDTEKENTRVRNSIVNIFCTTKTGGDLKPISGTGIIINKDGLILTNAHVAQYFLLKDYNSKDFITCIGRTGNPAIPEYTLELVYISNAWIENNSKKIKDEEPRGSGEHDYALLTVTGKINNNKDFDSISFPYLDVEDKEIFVIGTPVLLSAYPAGFLGGIAIQKDLSLLSSVSNISKLYYFESPGKTDLFALLGNILSQRGASGGAVVSLVSGKLLGIITTTTEAKMTGDRELGVVTLPYIENEFKNETGKDFFSIINNSREDNLKILSAESKKSLIKKITDVLDSN